MTLSQLKSNIFLLILVGWRSGRKPSMSTHKYPSASHCPVLCLSIISLSPLAMGASSSLASQCQKNLILYAKTFKTAQSRMAPIMSIRIWMSAFMRPLRNLHGWSKKIWSREETKVFKSMIFGMKAYISNSENLSSHNNTYKVWARECRVNKSGLVFN